jgi:hypothetical protein
LPYLPYFGHVARGQFFYAVNVLMQCAALVRLRKTHPHRLRPKTIIPAPLLLLPISVAVGIIAFSPAHHWAAAALLLGGTVVIYLILALVRQRGATPSARALAVAEALGVVSEDEAASQLGSPDRCGVTYGARRVLC